MKLEEIDPSCTESYWKNQTKEIILFEANKDREVVQGFWPNPRSEDELSDILENFDFHYNLDRKDELSQWWGNLFDSYMTQRLSLNLVCMAGDEVLETPTPAIFSGSSPVILYGVNQRFLDKYQGQISRSHDLQLELLEISQELNRDWAKMSGRAIENMRSTIKEYQTQVVNGDLANLTDVLKRVEENQQVIGRWAYLREKLIKKGRKFDFGWVRE